MEDTNVYIQVRLLEKYIKKSFSIFSRHKRVKTTSLWQDLVITTEYNYDKIYINWKECSIK